MTRANKIPLTVPIWVALMLLIACGGTSEADVPVVVPETATEARQTYADCIVTGLGVHPDIGYRHPENNEIWYIQRCQHLQPEPLEITSPEELTACIYAYGTWIADLHGIGNKVQGHAGTRAMIATETICAPTAVNPETWTKAK